MLRGLLMTIALVLTMSTSLANVAPEPKGQNIGVYGTIYKISEESLLGLIHDRLALYKREGKLKQMKREFIAHVKAQVLNPEPVSGVSNAKVNSVHYFTPTFTLTHNVYDAKGKLLFAAGTQVNSLSVKSIERVNPDVDAKALIFNEVWLFINGRDRSQVNWAQREVSKFHAKHKRVKVILVNGNLKRGFKDFGRIYFDQHGFLCHHFGITEVPTILSRDGTRLKLSTIAIKPERGNT